MIAAIYLSPPDSRLRAYFDQPCTPMQSHVSIALGPEGTQRGTEIWSFPLGLGKSLRPTTDFPGQESESRNLGKSLSPQASTYHGEKVFIYHTLMCHIPASKEAKQVLTGVLCPPIPEARGKKRLGAWGLLLVAEVETGNLLATELLAHTDCQHPSLTILPQLGVLHQPAQNKSVM